MNVDFLIWYELQSFLKDDIHVLEIVGLFVLSFLAPEIFRKKPNYYSLTLVLFLFRIKILKNQ